jgi:hypothetical protein
LIIGLVIKKFSSPSKLPIKLRQSLFLNPSTIVIMAGNMEEINYNTRKSCEIHFRKTTRFGSYRTGRHRLLIAKHETVPRTFRL